MKKGFLIKYLVLFAFVATAFAGAYIDYFHATADGDNVILEWKTSEETNVQNFVIQKRTPQSDFFDVATVQPNSSHIYQYVDKSAYKTNDVIYIYRLKIVDTDGSYTTIEDKTASVSLNISGIKRTWGSIKAMFR